MFDKETTYRLREPLHPKFVRKAPKGKYGDYVEGWHVIDEANRIFGFGHWHRETVDLHCVAETEAKVGKDKKDGWSVSYRAKVKVTVQGVVREGSGAGHGVSVNLGDAHESAFKEAETDAMKRALMTFGYPFGLALYDKDKNHVGVPPFPPGPERNLTSLKERVRKLWQEELPAYQSSDLLNEKLDECEPLFVQLRLAIPDWWNGGIGKDQQSFEGLGQWIDRRLHELRELERAQKSLDLQAISGGKYKETA